MSGARRKQRRAARRPPASKRVNPSDHGREPSRATRSGPSARAGSTRTGWSASSTPGREVAAGLDRIASPALKWTSWRAADERARRGRLQEFGGTGILDPSGVGQPIPPRPMHAKRATGDVGLAFEDRGKGSSPSWPRITSRRHGLWGDRGHDRGSTEPVACHLLLRWIARSAALLCFCDQPLQLSAQRLRRIWAWARGRAGKRVTRDGVARGASLSAAPGIGAVILHRSSSRSPLFALPGRHRASNLCGQRDFRAHTRLRRACALAYPYCPVPRTLAILFLDTSAFAFERPYRHQCRASRNRRPSLPGTQGRKICAQQSKFCSFPRTIHGIRAPLTVLVAIGFAARRCRGHLAGPRSQETEAKSPIHRLKPMVPLAFDSRRNRFSWCSAHPRRSHRSLRAPRQDAEVLHERIRSSRIRLLGHGFTSSGVASADRRGEHGCPSLWRNRPQKQALRALPRQRWTVTLNTVPPAPRFRSPGITS